MIFFFIIYQSPGDALESSLSHSSDFAAFCIALVNWTLGQAA